MGALDDIDILTGCCNLLLPVVEAREQEALDILSHTGSTVPANSLRALRVMRTVMAVGMFSIYEAALQDAYGWQKPFGRLKDRLQEEGHEQLAKSFDSYRLAVNVLKHGYGQSYRELLQRMSELDFQIRGDGSEFDKEGDVAAGQFLIDVNDDFVRRCAKLIESTRQVSRGWKR